MKAVLLEGGPFAHVDGPEGGVRGGEGVEDLGRDCCGSFKEGISELVGEGKEGHGVGDEIWGVGMDGAREGREKEALVGDIC